LLKRIGKTDPDYVASDLHNKLEIFYTLLEKDIPGMLKEIADEFSRKITPDGD
jgi:hypothetical protein